MQDEDARAYPGPEYDALPARAVTVNQVVSYNITYWRSVHGMTQEQLGERLQDLTGRPWSKATISAVERSWSTGKRIRMFDADELFAFSVALEVPISALLLPPIEDGKAERYTVKINSEDTTAHAVPMHQYFEYVLADVSSDEEGIDHILRECARRFEGSARFYFGDSYYETSASSVSEDVLRSRLHAIGNYVSTMRAFINDLEAESQTISKQLGTEDAGATEYSGLKTWIRLQTEDIFKAKRDDVLLLRLGHFVLRFVNSYVLETFIATDSIEDAAESHSERPICRQIREVIRDARKHATNYRDPINELLACIEASLPKEMERKLVEELVSRENSGEPRKAILEDLDLPENYYSLLLARYGARRTGPLVLTRAQPTLSATADQ